MTLNTFKVRRNLNLTVADRATFTDPFQYPVGIPTVIVNGRVVLDNGRHTGERPGVVIRGRGVR